MRVGLILGSVRHSSNSPGILKFLESLVRQHRANIDLDVIHLLHSPNHPLPYAIEDVAPAAHDRATLPDGYADPKVRAWSATVMKWDAVLIVSPEYNWGIPGILKNTFDHLYGEWVGKPAGIITFGSRGGSNCAEALKTVLGKGLRMSVVDKNVMISLPVEYIMTQKRLQGDEEVVTEHEGEIVELVEELVKRRMSWPATHLLQCCTTFHLKLVSNRT
jgi:NAD(P)H-dependent FMN reductase